MEWNSLFDKSEWLFRQILNREEKVPHEDSRLKDIAQKLSDSSLLAYIIVTRAVSGRIAFATSSTLTMPFE